jgi:hypothetical protein
MVDAQLAGSNSYGFLAWFAGLLYQLTGNPAYGTYAVRLVDEWVTGEEALIAGGQRPKVANDSYLYVGDFVGNLALVYDWCWGLLTSTQRTRWLDYANQAVWNVWHPPAATWGGVAHPWTGWATDNPSNNYYYSFLRATMLFGLAARGEHPAAEGWVTMFRKTKLEEQLLPAFEQALVGGGSREGTGYGTSHAQLFELYDWWEQSTGERIHDLTSHTRASLAAFLHVTVPTLDRIAPIGDHARDSTAALFDYHRRYVEILTFFYRNEPIASRGKWFLSHCSVPEMSSAFMYVYDFLYDAPTVVEAPLTGLHRAYYAAGIGQVYTRSSWKRDATWVNLIAGPYTESHAHRDQGSLLVYRNEWLADDQNLRSHSGIRQEEIMHNLVRIDQGGKPTRMVYETSSKLIALADEGTYTYAAADITPTYAGRAAVQRIERELVFLRPATVVVFDRVEGTANTARVWQLSTAKAPSLSGSTATIVGSKSTLTVHRLLPVGATTRVANWNGDQDMTGGGYRLEVADSGGNGRSRFLNVLSVDGAVAAATSDDSGSRLGVKLALADGRSATVRFESGTWGGTLQMHDGAGKVLVDARLRRGVAVLPLFDK